MKTTIERISNGLYILLFGLVLLWIMLGFISGNVIFQLLRLWPLFFVVAGIEIIFRRTRFYFLKIIRCTPCQDSNICLIWWVLEVD